MRVVCVLHGSALTPKENPAPLPVRGLVESWRGCLRAGSSRTCWRGNKYKDEKRSGGARCVQQLVRFGIRGGVALQHGTEKNTRCEDVSTRWREKISSPLQRLQWQRNRQVQWHRMNLFSVLPGVAARARSTAPHALCRKDSFRRCGTVSGARKARRSERARRGVGAKQCAAGQAMNQDSAPTRRPAMRPMHEMRRIRPAGPPCAGFRAPAHAERYFRQSARTGGGARVVLP